MKGLLLGAVALASLVPATSYAAGCTGSFGTINSVPFDDLGGCGAVSGANFSSYMTFTNALSWVNVAVTMSISDVNGFYSPGLFSLYQGTIGSGTLLDSFAPHRVGNAFFASTSGNHVGSGDYYVELTGTVSGVDTVSPSYSISANEAPAPTPGAGILSLSFFVLAGVMSRTAAPLRREIKRRLARI